MVTSLAILGQPGTAGLLRIMAISELQTAPIVLAIPFRLAPCNMGFKMSSSVVRKAELNLRVECPHQNLLIHVLLRSLLLFNCVVLMNTGLVQ